MINSLKDIVAGMQGESERGIGFISSRDTYEYVTYAELYDEILKMSRKLQGIGMKNEDKVIFQIAGMKNFVCAFWACIVSDLVPVPLGRITNKENFNRFEQIVKSIEGSYVIYDKKSDYIENVDNKVCIMDYMSCERALLNPKVRVHQTAFVQYSSGSTGNPKGVILTHENLISNVRAIIDKIRIVESDKSLSWLPLSHDMGLIGFHITPAYLHANHYLMSTQLFMMKPQKWLEYLDEYQVSMTGAPNFAIEKIANAEIGMNLLSASYDLSHLRIVFNGSEAISNFAVKKFQEVLKNSGIRQNVIYPVYGLAEATLAVAFPEENMPIQTLIVNVNDIEIGRTVSFGNDKNCTELVCVGSGLACDTVTIRDEQGDILPELTLGHICVEGESIAEYYLIGSEKKKISTTEYLNTGDIGFIKDQKLYVIGRENEIVLKGQNFYLVDAEALVHQVFKSCNCSSETIIVPIYENKQYKLVLFVKGEYSLQIMKAAKSARKKVRQETGITLTEILFVDDIPYTNSGKVKRIEIRSRYARNQYQNRCIQITPDMGMGELTDGQQIITDLFEETLGFRPGINYPLMHCEIDSIEYYMYLGKLEEYFHIHFEMDQMWDCISLDDLLVRINRLKKEEVTMGADTAEDNETIGT